MTAATEERGGRGALRERLSEVVSQLAAAGALIVVFVFLSFASPVFLSADNLFNIGSQTAVVAVIAIGMTLVIITAGIDLSVGSVSALSGVLGVMLMAQAGLPVPVAILGGTLVGATCGLVNGFLVSVAGLNPFIATLGMLTVARGLTFIVTNAVAVFGAPSSFRLLGQGVIGPIPIPILVIVVMAVIGYFVLSRTRLGRYAYAMGSNLEAARLSGIPIRRYLTSVYVISAAVIGGASLFGGQGTVVGTLIGAFLIALIRNGAVLLDVNTFYQQVIIGVVIWLAVFWDQYRRRRLAAASE